MTNNLIIRLLDRCPQLDHNTAYLSKKGSISFYDLRHQCLSAAYFFQRRPIKPKQIVALYCDDDLLMPSVWFGLIIAGAVPLVIPKSEDSSRLRDIIQQAGIKHIIVDSILPELSCDQILLDRSLVEQGTVTVDPHEPTSDDDVFCILSSGTTSGHHKIIAHRWDNLYESFALTQNPYQLTDQSRVYCSVQLGTSWGMMIGLIGCLAVRYSVWISPCLNDLRHLDSIWADNKITHAMLFPRALAFVCDHFDRLPFSLERVYIGGEWCAPTMIDLFQNKFGIPAHDTFGCGEVRCWAIMVNTDDQQKIGSVGRLGPGVQVSLINDRGEPVSPGDTGRLAVKHPGIFKRYHGDEIKSRICLRDGWIYTQDYMRVDADGFYFYMGRHNDALHIEHTLTEMLNTQEIVVIYEDDKKIAFLPAALRESMIGSSVSDYVDEVCFVTTIPTTAGTGKKTRNIDQLKKYVV